MSIVSESLPTKPTRTGSLHRSAARIHRIAGVLVAPFILFAALTGFLYAFAPTLEQVYYRKELTATSGQPARPLAEQVSAAQQVHPSLSVAAVQVSEAPTATTRILFADPSLPSSSYSQAVFVDPGDLRITGSYVQYGSSRALPLRTWLSEGHRSLWLGEPGRLYSELATSWLGAIALTDLWVWWCQRRRRSVPGPRRTHIRLGVLAAPGLVFLAITGLTWSRFAGDTIATWRKNLQWTTPKPDNTLPNGATAPARDPATQVDQVITAAREHGLTGDISATIPKADAVWVVQEVRAPWRMATDTVVVDGSGELLRTLPFADWPLVAKATSWLIQLHMGTLFGLLSQVALGLLAAGIMALIVLGYRM